MSGNVILEVTRGYKFSTYAYHWIRQAITRAVAQQSRTIRLPVHITEKLNKIKKTQQHLSQQLGRTPTVTEVAQSLGLTALHLQQLLEWTRKLISLNVSVGSDHDTELGELLLDTGATPEDLVFQTCLADDLKQLVADLTPPQRDVLTLRFGLEDGQPLTLAAVGSRLKLSRSRVRQLEQKAIDTLRHHKPMLVEYFIANDASK